MSETLITPSHPYFDDQSELSDGLGIMESYNSKITQHTGQMALVTDK